MTARARDNGPALHVYLRRSKAKQGHQQFSLDVQRDGSRQFVLNDLPRSESTCVGAIDSSTSTTIAPATTSSDAPS